MTPRPVVRLDAPRTARPGDLDAHQPDSWQPVQPGGEVSVFVGFGISTDPLDVIGLARHLRPAHAVRVAGRTPSACRSARSTLSALWRGEELEVHRDQ